MGYGEQIGMGLLVRRLFCKCGAGRDASVVFDSLRLLWIVAS